MQEEKNLLDQVFSLTIVPQDTPPDTPCEAGVTAEQEGEGVGVATLNAS